MNRHGIDEKTFMVTGDSGAKIEALQVTTLAYYVQNIQFRFVVTRTPGSTFLTVTERNSGKRVCDLPVLTPYTEAKDAAKKALDALIEKHGEARVRSVLDAG